MGQGMSRSTVSIIILSLLTMGFALRCSYMQADIEGLTTRVNLLEARIHWQESRPSEEEPPK